MVKLIKILWLLLSLAIAVWGVQADGDAQLVVIYLIGFLTMPLGLVVYVLGSLALSAMTGANNESHGLTVNIVMSLLAIAAGYIQWFILLPKLIRRMRNEKSAVAWGLALLGLVLVLYGLYRFYLHVFPSTHT